MLVDRKQMDLYEKQTKEKNREGDSRDKSGLEKLQAWSYQTLRTRMRGKWGRMLVECLFNSLNSDLWDTLLQLELPPCSSFSFHSSVSEQTWTNCVAWIKSNNF